MCYLQPVHESFHRGCHDTRIGNSGKRSPGRRSSSMGHGDLCNRSRGWRIPVPCTGGVTFLVCCWQTGQACWVLGFNTRGYQGRLAGSFYSSSGTTTYTQPMIELEEMCHLAGFFRLLEIWTAILPQGDYRF